MQFKKMWMGKKKNFLLLKRFHMLNIRGCGVKVRCYTGIFILAGEYYFNIMPVTLTRASCDFLIASFVIAVHVSRRYVSQQ